MYTAKRCHKIQLDNIIIKRKARSKWPDSINKHRTHIDFNRKISDHELSIMFEIIAQCHRDLYHFLVEQNKQKMKKMHQTTCHNVRNDGSIFYLFFSLWKITHEMTTSGPIRMTSHCLSRAPPISGRWSTRCWLRGPEPRRRYCAHTTEEERARCVPTREQRKMTMRADCHFTSAGWAWDTAIRPVLDILQDAQ